MYASLFTVLIVCLCGIHAQVNHIECPRCTDSHNSESCTERHTCVVSSDVCQLRVHKHDRNRIEYTCLSDRICNLHEARGCDNDRLTCSYCCHSYTECLQELKIVFAALQPTHTPATTRPTTSSHVTHQVFTTPEESPSFTYGVTTSVDVTTSDAVPTSDDFITSGANSNTTTDFTDDTTEADFATTTTEEILTSVPVEFLTTLTPEFSDFPTTAKTRNSCFQCGDFAYDKPCTQIELLLDEASACPEELPYCFETVNLSGGNLQVMRGCAEANFCRVEWDLGHSRSGCYPLDVRAGNFSCTYCCSGNSCNSITPPADKDQVTFP